MAFGNFPWTFMSYRWAAGQGGALLWSGASKGYSR
jgi:hypothetical protein